MSVGSLHFARLPGACSLWLGVVFAEQIIIQAGEDGDGNINRENRYTTSEPTWSNNYIKFFSEKTLGLLLREAGFTDISFIRAGRIPVLAKSLVAVVRK